MRAHSIICVVVQVSTLPLSDTETKDAEISPIRQAEICARGWGAGGVVRVGTGGEQA